MHIPSSRGGVAALGPLLLLLSAPDAGARRCANSDTMIELSNGTNISSFHAFFGPRCWNPTLFDTTVHLNGSRGCPTDSKASCGESLSGCDNFNATAAFADGTFAGKLMLMERGGCSFALKAVSAANAGAIGLLIFSDGRDARAMQDNGDACVVLNECPGDAENLTIPTLMIQAAEGAMMIADPALLTNVLWDCPDTPDEAQCGSLAPTLPPTTSSPTSDPTTSAPTSDPTTLAPTTSSPTSDPTTSAPTSEPTSSPTVYAGPTLLLQLSIVTETLNDTQIADLKVAVQSLFATAAAAVVPPVFATAEPRVQVQPAGVVSIALLNLNGAGIAFEEVRSVALELDGSSTDNITDFNGTSFGSFQVLASTAMPAPTAPPTASPSPPADAPAPDASDTGLDSTTVVIIVVGTIVFLLVALNLVLFFMYKRDDSANTAQSDLTTVPSGRLTTAQRKAGLARDLNGIANASLPRNPHFYPATPELSDGYSISGAPFGGDSNAPDPAAVTDRAAGYSNRHYDQNGLGPRGARVSFAQGRGYAPAQQRQPSIGSGGGGRAPNQWYPSGATANNKKKRLPKKDKLQQPGQSVLARVGAQPWSFDSNRS